MTTHVALAPAPGRSNDPLREQTVTRAQLRQRISAELELLSGELADGAQASPLRSGTRAGRVAMAAAQGRVRWLGQLLAGLAASGELHLDPENAGFGSILQVTEVASGQKTSFTLMTGATIDITGDQVSMESPIGAALVGRASGDIVEVDTPAGTRTFRVDSVKTLIQQFGA